MKLRCSKQMNQAMTLIEAVLVIFVIAFLAIMLLPAIMHPRHHHGYIRCANNLKQVGLAYKIWAGDNNDKYPMEVSVTNGGAMEFMNTTDAWKTFQVMSNELSTPKLLYCPEDSLRAGYATNWGDDLKNKISYFINIDAKVNGTNLLLVGDDNFSLNGATVKPGLLNLISNSSATWDSSRHTAYESHFWTPVRSKYSGYVVLGDGSVDSLNSDQLQTKVSHTGLATNRLVIP